MDGLATTAELRRREAAGEGHVPVVAITASTLEGDRVRCLQAGMDDYLVKPLRADALRDVLVRWGPAGSDRPARAVATAPASRDGFQSLDCRVLAESCGGLPALMADVLEAFLRSTPASLSALEAAVVAPDLQRAAHHLRGACQTIGAEAMATDCAELLALARQGQVAGAATRLEALRQHWDGARAEASAFLETLRSC
jgi:CheY-like chemotaxis protein